MALLIALLLATCIAAEHCCLEVVEKGTDWPVPLVMLSTTNHQQFVTDNAGVAAFDAPELMGQPVWLDVRSHGYGAPPDGFGLRGVRVVPQPGKTLRIEVERFQVAKRIGRLTGGGLFAEAAKCGDRAPAETGILGCDSVQTAVFAGRRHWFWGDTTLAKHPLGIFHSTGATTAVGEWPAARPPWRFDFKLFRGGDGQPRGVAAIPGRGPKWLTAVATLPDAAGREHLVATYFRVQPPLAVAAVGQCEWRPATAEFQPVGERWERSAGVPGQPAFPEGHAVAWTDEQGKPWALFGDPFPRLKMPARYEAWLDRTQWTALPPPPDPVDVANGQPVRVHRGMIAWHGGSKRWLAVFCQEGGKPSHLGEIWCAGAASPFGPWGPAVKVATHDNYSFYNPVIHPELSAAAPNALCFEGTYTTMFADRAMPTPRWEYNQVLYRLELDDPRLKPVRGD